MIHPQLLADCHLLGRFEMCAVLLNRNAALPWFILVPETDLEDVLDLPAAQLARVGAECQQLSRFLKQSLGYSKVNFAGLGNVVPQMHLHIIARSSEDACWPQPVWGNLSDSADYPVPTLQHWTAVLASEYGLDSSAGNCLQ
jgi:diadenosine tetraphosphate (Ap4A) HIT family hydrolase